MNFKQFIHKEFEHHHAFVLILASIALFFGGNVLAFNTLENNVLQSAFEPVDSPSVIVAKQESEDANAREDEPVNKLEPLQSTLNEFTKNTSVTSAVWLQDATTGDFVTSNGSVTFPSASLYKLFVAYEVYQRVDLGIYTLDQIIETSEEGQTIEACLKKSIDVSDNPCGRALRELVSANIEPLPSLAEAGFTGTSLVNDYPTTTARDVALLFNKLYSGSDLSEASNQAFLTNLKNQTVANRIPAGLPENLEIAHKTGDLEGYSHDGGIVYTEFGDYILVILSGPWSNGYDDAPPVIANFVSNLYDELKSLD